MKRIQLIAILILLVTFNVYAQDKENQNLGMSLILKVTGVLKT
ncbi:hypothetical protein ADIWIN_2375 [Winogradskyella psychrotolerans RS-3]|uniref:Uncharacterized protein n=1 Tax=Winogradskyella psychrotolerans RS-3 TaxID=641526 RepID=S7VQW8_9FLAO|nr:hypothetical protein ADIWIN_2375 [Winogradskyella psychrotolerans RS-3]